MAYSFSGSFVIFELGPSSIAYRFKNLKPVFRFFRFNRAGKAAFHQWSACLSNAVSRIVQLISSGKRLDHVFRKRVSKSLINMVRSTINVIKMDLDGKMEKEG